MDTRVVFFQVRDAAAKLQAIIETAHLHFEKKEPLVIFVEDEKGEAFVDDLLWKSPSTSFLPHSIASGPSKDLVAITRLKQNVNNAKIAFNLCPTPLLIEGPFRIIYDFEDLTSPHKQSFSALRFDAYKNAHFLCEARS